MYSRLSDDGKKTEETRSSPLLQSIQNFPWKPGGCGTSQCRVNAEPTDLCLICYLDLSKILMYDFHHNYIKRKYTDFLKYARSMKFSLPISIYSIFFGRKKKGHSIMWKQKSNRQNEGRVQRGNYWTAGRFESENIFIENNERTNEKG